MKYDFHLSCFCQDPRVQDMLGPIDRHEKPRLQRSYLPKLSRLVGISFKVHGLVTRRRRTSAVKYHPVRLEGSVDRDGPRKVVLRGLLFIGHGGVHG